MLQLFLVDLVVCYPKWAVLFVELVRLEEGPPLLKVDPLDLVDSLALFEDIRHERLPLTVCLAKGTFDVFVDGQQPAPVQVLELLLDLVFL